MGFLKIIYIIFGCAGPSQMHEGFLLLQQAGAALHCSAQASYCDDFSCYRAQALGTQVSAVAVLGL